MAKPWQLDLDGKGRLVSPHGVVREFPYRHVADLLAVLAEARPNEMQREALAQMLWAEYPREERLTNLRQALSRLRSYVGANAIDADRRGCRLDPRFPLEVVGVCRKVSGCPELRTAPASDESHSTLLGLPPDASYEWIRTHVEAGIGLPPRVLRALLEVASNALKPQSEDERWLDFWNGFASLATDLPRSGVRLARSHRAAIVASDIELTSVSGFWLGINCILSGDISSAERIGKRAEMLIPKRAAGERLRILNLRAHVLLHSGRSDEALVLFDQLTNAHVGSLTEQAPLKALHALYLTYAGRYMPAERLLCELESLAKQGESQATRAYVHLTAAVLDTLDLQAPSMAKAEELAEQFKRDGAPQMELYTRELLVVRAQERSSLGLGRSQAHRIKALRQQLGLAYTLWDFQRLTPSRFA